MLEKIKTFLWATENTMSCRLCAEWKSWPSCFFPLSRPLVSGAQPHSGQFLQCPRPPLPVGSQRMRPGKTATGGGSEDRRELWESWRLWGILQRPGPRPWGSSIAWPLPPCEVLSRKGDFLTSWEERMGVLGPGHHKQQRPCATLLTHNSCGVSHSVQSTFISSIW